MPITAIILRMKQPLSSSSCGGGGGGLYPWSTDDFRDELRLLPYETILNGHFKVILRSFKGHFGTESGRSQVLN